MLCKSLSRADKLNEICGAIIAVAESGEFDSAVAEWSCDGHVMLNARVMEIAQGESGKYDLRMFDGRIRWNWQPQSSLEDTRGAEELWTIRLPIARDSVQGYLNLSRSLTREPLLFDVNYLTNVFQPAITDATQRTFDRAAASMPRQRHASAG